MPLRHWVLVFFFFIASCVLGLLWLLAKHESIPTEFRRVDSISGVIAEFPRQPAQYGVLYLANQKEYQDQGFYISVPKEIITILRTITAHKNRGIPILPLMPSIRGIFIEGPLTTENTCAVRIEYKNAIMSTCLDILEGTIIAVASQSSSNMDVAIFARENLFKTARFEYNLPQTPTTIILSGHV